MKINFLEKKENQKKESPTTKITQKKETKPTFTWRILKAPHITEKSTELARKNQYTFLVDKEANKIEIKRAIEEKYNVKVEKVRIIKMPGKRRRVGRTIGWKKGFKKAIVTIKEGQKIDIFPT
jgi:large subunit ribosomal protein L23